MRLAGNLAGTGRDVLEAGKGHALNTVDWTARTAVNTARRAVEVLAAEDAFSKAYDRSSTGVVTFASPGVAATVAQLQLSDFRGCVAVRGVAPSRGDMEWRNVGNNARGVDNRRWLADAGLCWIAVLWTPFIGSIQALANIEELAEKKRNGDYALPWLRTFVHEERYETAKELVQGYLPVILVLVLLLVLPILVEQLALRYVGFKTKSAIQAYVLARHFWFQLLTIFVTVLSGSALVEFGRILKRPGYLITYLGANLPSIGTYFLQLLIVKSLFSTAFELARPHQLALDVSRVNALINRSNRQRGEPPGYTEFKYGHIVPQILMVVLVVSIYAAIAPLLLPFGFVFFFLAELIYARNFLLVYVRRYESGGDFLWPYLFYFTVVSLAIGQVTMISYISLLGGLNQFPLLVPLPFLSYVHYKRVMRRYVEPAKFLHREAVADHRLFDPLSRDLDANYYKQTVLTVDAAHPASAAFTAHRERQKRTAETSFPTPPPSPSIKKEAEMAVTVATPAPRPRTLG